MAIVFDKQTNIEHVIVPLHIDCSGSLAPGYDLLESMEMIL